MNENIKGEEKVIVGNSIHEAGNTKQIDLISPANDGIEKNATLNIIANAPELPNSPYAIYLNNSIVNQ
jgi:hypothetical protein